MVSDGGSGGEPNGSQGAGGGANAGAKRQQKQS